ncbi:hypothetical protein [Nonlabens ulvanivorans]|uniref:Uncharacterized protein n=1 Tax=Nonlabens ulvanivorans TaxID=906888 RepID=A0A084JYE4_NONUL|nr:hypothetical protein [Nonlabens ulvanivorans]KEZ93978.1 hypothetical protein IL45_07240 [Nonlabens ulvanivorans]PRX14597.1 hypothetical protein LY02_01629 [Nonlabens ulvanivorans]
MEKDIYLQQIDYFKGARVLHYFEFVEPQEVKDEYFNVHEIHAVVICDYEGEETMLFYLDDGLEVVLEFEFMISKQAKEQAATDFNGIDIQWKNR